MASFVPANDTALGDWTNGTLFPQIETYLAVYHGQNQDMNLTVLPNNLASLTFSVNENTSLAFPLVAAVFDPSQYLIEVNCIHPLSGQYDMLSRVFYVLIVFSLVFRRHEWISVAALGTTMSLSPHPHPLN